MILIQQDGAPPGAEMLARAPEALTVAVDAGAPDAAATARAWRDAGHEIVLVPSLPTGATPQDVEQALQSNLSTVPSAVAVLAGGDTGFQADRDATQQVVDALSATGHGLVTVPRGLNRAQRIAEDEGVPSAVVFREMTGDSAAMTLNRAAFQARQGGDVILMGPADADTLQAVADWAAGAEAGGVAFAPLSAVLAPEAETDTAPDRPGAFGTGGGGALNRGSAFGN